MNNINLKNELEQNIEGEIRFDQYSKILYSTDASIYQIEPIGVVIPKTESDVITTIKIADKHEIPVIPRGAGTSLGGQVVGNAIIIDFSKYMNEIIELNTEEKWVRVQPGVVLDELNAYLKEYGLMFGPDVASGDRANIGGLIGNNSAGARSIVYGTTVDHVLELKSVLSNGDVVSFGALEPDELNAKMQGDSLESQVYQKVKSLIDENHQEIIERYPNILRRVAGYNLDEFVNDEPFNLSKLIVGSEGTLATVLEAKLKVVPTPKMTGLEVISFKSLMESLSAVNPILDHNVSSVELLDDTVLNLSKDSNEYFDFKKFIDESANAVLIVEFFGESEQELNDKLTDLEDFLRKENLGYYYTKAIDQKHQDQVWAARKAGLGFLSSMVGNYKPVGFVEDTAVPTEKLPEYVQRFKEIVESHDTKAAYYAHASAACLHIRPLLNLKSAEDIEKMRSIAEKISDLVLEFEGAMSAEHGDGMVRSEWTEKMFGSQLYQVFKQLKKAFDPKGIMNPGKIVDSQKINENLRYGADYKATEWDTYFDFSKQNGLAGSIEMCSGVGVCRRKLEGNMCPSFRATLDERDSPRGRANALRAIISGKLPKEELTSERLYEVFDLCLMCKSCKSECPSKVDIAKLKYEFLGQYYKEHSLPLRSLLFGNIDLLSKFGSAFAPVSNWFMTNGLFAFFMDKLVGIDKRRKFPTFARNTFKKWYKNRNGENGSNTEAKQVVFFFDTFVNHNEPHIGIALVKVLEAAGFEIILPDKKCCGRPMISKGLIEKAIKNAKYNVEKLFPYVEKGIPIVGCEPSCVAALRDDYVDLVNDERAKRISENTYMIEEFLLMLRDRDELTLKFKETPTKKILVHGHCHQKALMGNNPSIEMLESIPGYQVKEIDVGCCGMAGAFGYEKEHYTTSMEVGEKLFDAIRNEEGEFDVMANGTSCRQQILDGTNIRAKHMAELIAEAIDES